MDANGGCAHFVQRVDPVPFWGVLTVGQDYLSAYQAGKVLPLAGRYQRDHRFGGCVGHRGGGVHKLALPPHECGLKSVWVKNVAS